MNPGPVACVIPLSRLPNPIFNLRESREGATERGETPQHCFTICGVFPSAIHGAEEISAGYK